MNCGVRFGPGSSPRGWGGPSPEDLKITRQRFIPTRVGRTFGMGVLEMIQSVHPHAGGEDPWFR